MSLFGQVWLWSLAAFLLGSLLTWLLLVWPARRRITELERYLHAQELSTRDRAEEVYLPIPSWASDPTSFPGPQAATPVEQPSAPQPPVPQPAEVPESTPPKSVSQKPAEPAETELADDPQPAPSAPAQPIPPIVVADSISSDHSISGDLGDAASRLAQNEHLVDDLDPDEDVDAQGKIRSTKPNSPS